VIGTPCQECGDLALVRYGEKCYCWECWEFLDYVKSLEAMADYVDGLSS
jgi:hypothetical protein